MDHKQVIMKSLIFGGYRDNLRLTHGPDVSQVPFVSHIRGHTRALELAACEPRNIPVLERALVPTSNVYSVDVWVACMLWFKHAAPGILLSAVVQ